METLLGVTKFIHIASALLLAWPYYALTAVNHRALLGPPLGDRTDIYMENIIRSRSIPCFVFQATVLVTGIGLMLMQGRELSALVSDPPLGVKFLLLLLIVGLLAYVHTVLQPRIDTAFAEAGEAPIAKAAAGRIGAMRLRRKRIATICLFVVLTNAALGVQVSLGMSGMIVTVLIVAIAAFTWRAYSSVTPFGWI